MVDSINNNESKTYWIIPSRPKYFDLEACFKTYGFVDWRGSFYPNIGDIVYVYLSKPVAGYIKYKCEVINNNLKKSEVVNQKQFFLSEEEKHPKEKVRLRLLKRLNTDDFVKFEKMKELGLKSQIQGPLKKIPAIIINYLESKFNTNGIVDNTIERYNNEAIKQKAIEYSKRMLNKSYVSKTHVYSRNELVSEYVKHRSQGRCDLCDNKAPFEIDNKPYLECHHVLSLSDGGLDTVFNAVALCPNCHRKIHLLKAHNEIVKLKNKILYYSKNEFQENEIEDIKKTLKL